MNLVKLFEMQRKLDERIDYSGQDRFEKKVLALLTELGECANEWRGFKFWSKDQEPREKLLEETVDCLHFILSLGIEKGFVIDLVDDCLTCSNVTIQFKAVMSDAIEFDIYTDEICYLRLIKRFLGLNEMLGFTWEQIEQAYFEKNEVNHQRQAEGY